LEFPAHCWRRHQGDGRVCVDVAAWHGERIQLVGGVSELPVAELNVWFAGLPELSGSVGGRWDLTASQQRWSGLATLESAQLGIVDRSDATTVDLIELGQVTIRASLTDNRTTVALQAIHDSVAVLDANVAIGGFDTSAPLAGYADVRFDDLGGLSTLSRRIGAVDGALKGRFDFAGTVGAPTVSGTVAMHDGRLVLVDPHVELVALDLAVQMSDLSQVSIRGEATSGEGHLKIDGTLLRPFTADRGLQVRVDARRVPVRVPDADLHVSGQLDGEWRTGLMSLKGSIEIPRAEITIGALPEGAVAVSNDVIVIDRVEQRAAGTRLQVDIEVVLQDDVHFEAFGLDTNLDGHLRLRQSADGLIQINGTVALVKGTFTGYGQILQIESGRLTYSGPPENPFIDARATRKIKNLGSEITVGAHVQGPARDIETTLFSDPEMSEAEALSYLVLGRPLNGASAQESNNVMGAAIALGLKGASPVINEIRDIVGIDELTATGGSTEDLALIAGKRLSDRVSLRYQYQTFTRTGAVLIELLLSRRLSLEATAAQAPAIDVIYRVGEYD
jgi:translocation and assembly module TamB